MKSIKIAALIIGAIALFPSVSLAQNVSGSVQSANLSSVTVGTGNVTAIDTTQSLINLQQAGTLGANVAGTSQTVNANAITVGNQNLTIQQALQQALNGQAKP